MIFVSVVIDEVLFRLTGNDVFLRLLLRVLFEGLLRLFGFDLFVFVPCIALFRDLDNGCINDGTAFGQVSLLCKKVSIRSNILSTRPNSFSFDTSLGHPIGFSGARIIVMLLTALERNNVKRGLASRSLGEPIISCLHTVVYISVHAMENSLTDIWGETYSIVMSICYL